MRSVMDDKFSIPGGRDLMKKASRHMWLTIFYFLIYPIGPSPLPAEDKPFCDQIASYTMNVKLDIEHKTISASELLSWTNATEIPTDELWFHLYWNGFQNNMSDFLVEGTQRWGRVFRKNKKRDWGYCRVDAIKIEGDENYPETDLKPSMRFRHPDNDNGYDQTVFSVRLPKSVEPGQTLRLEILFHSQVPRPIHRTGTHKDYYFIGQWFPKIGVFDRGQWNCHQFHATTNFFADFGTYDVKITLPSSFIIGATGEHIEKTEHPDGTTTHRFVQPCVHDFAWTASPYYLEYIETFEFAPGKSTEITLLLQPYHENQKDRYMNAVKNSLRYCSLWYGDYPYSTITCVDPAYNSRSGGMEYPTLFSGGSYFLSPEGTGRPEGVTIHEFGHGYFYGLVATNEFEDAWMDEGFTSFLDSEVYRAAYCISFYSRSYLGIPVVFKDVSIPIESSGISRHRQTYDMDIMQNFTWHFINSSSYGANSYSKAELMLRTLKRFMGAELFAAMIKAYSQRHWFKHPQPQDFYATVSEFAGQDMSWFLDQFVYGSESLDYALGDISNTRTRIRRGWFDGEFTEEKRKAEGQAAYRSEVVVRRLGGVKIPVDVLIVFEDGSEVQESWDGQHRWKRFSYTSPVGIRYAVVDPEFKLVLDLNRTNNSSTAKPNKVGALKWTGRWMTWLQHALEFFALFGG
jgi:hypothetical protein